MIHLMGYGNRTACCNQLPENLPEDDIISDDSVECGMEGSET